MRMRPWGRSKPGLQFTLLRRRDFCAGRKQPSKTLKFGGSEGTVSSLVERRRRERQARSDGTRAPRAFSSIGHVLSMRMRPWGRSKPSLLFTLLRRRDFYAGRKQPSKRLKLVAPRAPFLLRVLAPIAFSIHLWVIFE